MILVYLQVPKVLPLTQLLRDHLCSSGPNMDYQSLPYHSRLWPLSISYSTLTTAHTRPLHHREDVGDDLSERNISIPISCSLCDKISQVELLNQQQELGDVSRHSIAGSWMLLAFPLGT